MRECRTYGSERGAWGNPRPYRDRRGIEQPGAPLATLLGAICFAWTALHAADSKQRNET
jgi:hypothetical protein